LAKEQPIFFRVFKKGNAEGKDYPTAFNLIRFFVERSAGFDLEGKEGALVQACHLVVLGREVDGPRGRFGSATLLKVEQLSRSSTDIGYRDIKSRGGRNWVNKKRGKEGNPLPNGLRVHSAPTGDLNRPGEKNKVSAWVFQVRGKAGGKHAKQGVES